MAGPIPWWGDEHLKIAHNLAALKYQLPEIARRLSRRFGREITPAALDRACRRLGRPLRTPRGRPRGGSAARQDRQARGLAGAPQRADCCTGTTASPMRHAASWCV